MSMVYFTPNQKLTLYFAQEVCFCAVKMVYSDNDLKKVKHISPSNSQCFNFDLFHNSNVLKPVSTQEYL